MNNLWQRYTGVLHGKGIMPPFDRWYVIRAEEFLKNHKGKRFVLKRRMKAGFLVLLFFTK